MDTVTILRELWSRRLPVLGVAALALVAGMLVLYQASFPPKPRGYHVGVATTNILIDTPTSAVIDVSPVRGSGSLGARANLLASLMAGGVVKQEIAQTAGLNPNDLAGKSASTTGQTVNPPAGRDTPMLTTAVITDTTSDAAVLPIIDVQAQAKDQATAIKLANASVVGLRSYLDSQAAAERIPDAQRLKVTALGPPQAQTVQRGPSPLLAVIAAIGVFVLGCGVILAVLAITRGWRAAEAREAGEFEGEPLARPTDSRDPDAEGFDYSALPFGAADPREANPSDDWSDSWLVPDSAPLVTTTQRHEQSSDENADERPE